MFLPNVIKIDLYNFELYCFKCGAFFETQCGTMLVAFRPTVQMPDLQHLS